MKTYDAPAATAGLAASIFVIGALIARLFSGRIMDRVGRKRLLIIGAVLEVAFSALYLAGLGLWLLFALRLLHGIAFGTCSTAIGTIVTALVPDNRKGEGVGYYMPVSYTHLLPSAYPSANPASEFGTGVMPAESAGMN